MVNSYYTYRIRVANFDHVQVEKWDEGNQSKGQPSGRFRYKEKREEIESMLKVALDNKLSAMVIMKLGELLFDIIFDDQLCIDFVNCYYDVVQNKKIFLRVELDIDEQLMPNVAALPWEFMRVPQRTQLGSLWIATLPNLVFSRRRSQWIAAQPIQLKPGEKLKIALVISAPCDLPYVAYESIKKTLESFAISQSSKIDFLPVLKSANPESIDNLLLKKPHIFHFIGHGRMRGESEEDVGQIALVDPDLHGAMWVNSDYFSELFNQHRPAIILLQSCESGMLSSSQAFVGVASKIVQQNIPVVVAMQYQVTNSTASRFSLQFYKKLADQYPVDIAVQLGRRAIALSNTKYYKRDFATPVIFMRVQNGYLFDYKNQGNTLLKSVNKIIHKKSITFYSVLIFMLMSLLFYIFNLSSTRAKLEYPETYVNIPEKTSTPVFDPNIIGKGFSRVKKIYDTPDEYIKGNHLNYPPE